MSEPSPFLKVLARNYNTGADTYDAAYLASECSSNREFIGGAATFDDTLFLFLAKELCDDDMSTPVALDRLDNAIAQLQEVRDEMAGLPYCLGTPVPEDDESDGEHAFNGNGVCIQCGEKDKRG